MYKRKRISARMHFISITKWSEIEKREKTRSSARSFLRRGRRRSRTVGKPIFSSRVLTHLFCRSCRPLSGALSLTYEGYTESLSRWNSKGRTPTLRFYLVSGAPCRAAAARPSPDGGTGDETKRITRTRAHASLDRSGALSTRNTLGFVRHHIASVPQCCKKGFREHVNK